METSPASKEDFKETAGSRALSAEEIKPSLQVSARTSMEISEAMVDFPAVRTTPPSSTTFMKKKKKKKMMIPTVRRHEGHRHVNPSTSRRLERFCKHRNGLFKRARELSNCCDAEVAAIVFSPSGMVSKFASSSMNRILKRYQSFQPQMRSSNILLHDKLQKPEANLLDCISENLQELKRFTNVSSPISIENYESILTKNLEKIHKKKMELLEVEIKKVTQQGETLIKENIALEEKIMQIISGTEWISNATSGSNDICSE